VRVAGLDALCGRLPCTLGLRVAATLNSACAHDSGCFWEVRLEKVVRCIRLSIGDAVALNHPVDRCETSVREHLTGRIRGARDIELRVALKEELRRPGKWKSCARQIPSGLRLIA
jgi:hypothetical protein